MSATGRSDVRHPDDFYATPAWVTRAILPALFHGAASDNDLLDPCAGVGSILDAIRGVEAGPSCSLRGMEIDAGRAIECQGKRFPCEVIDALRVEWGGPHFVVMNPPFKLAMEFVTKAIAEIGEGGSVAALLRLNWLASMGRRAFHVENPSDVFILPKRPSFTGSGTDSAEYAWFVWGPGRGNRWRILDVEPRS